MATRPRTAPRKNPKQARAHATVDAILTATARVLVKEGYDRASTNRIARAAGVSVGSLYQYFPSKEALVAALIERHSDRCREKLENTFVALASARPDSVARGLIGVMIEMKLVDPALEKVLIEQIPRVGRMAKLREVEERMMRLLTVYLEGQRLRADTDAEAAAFVLVKAGSALAHAIAIDRPSSVTVAQLEYEWIELVLRYLSGMEATVPSRSSKTAIATQGAMA